MNSTRLGQEAAKKWNFVTPIIPYNNSLPIPEHLLDGYFSRFEPRRNIAFEDEIIDVRRVEGEFVSHGGLILRHGSLSSVGGFTSVFFPEANPMRVRNVSALASLAFIEDDVIDGEIFFNEQKEHTETRDRDELRRSYERILTQMKARTYLEMLADCEGAIECVQGYDEWVVNTSPVVTTQYKDLDEYMEKTYIIMGANLTANLSEFCHGFNLTKEERANVAKIKVVAYTIAVLMNDFFGAEMNWVSPVRLGDPAPPPSAVSVIMRTQDVCFSEAKAIIIREFTALESEFLRLREPFQDDAVSIEVKRFILSLETMIAGAVIWHLKNTRYEVDPADAFYPKPQDKMCDWPGYKGVNSSDKKQSSNVAHPNVLLKEPGSPANVNGTSATGPRSPWLSTYPKLSDKVVLEPSDYIASLPSKRIRSVAIKALDIWYRVPTRSVDIISSVVDILHSSSLIIDDIEDNSSLRRGFPSTHMLYGIPQAINAANYLFATSLQEVQKLGPAAVEIYTDELRNLHIGQGLDLHSSFHTSCPKEEEYIRMIDGKTGGLFRLACRLMRLEATRNKTLDTEYLFTMVGRFFQIRDDYHNLGSADYASQKGSLSDLDEGKYSFILVHALTSPTTNDGDKNLLLSLLRLRSVNSQLLPEQKQLVMKTLARTKSMEYTKKVLEELQVEIRDILEKIEAGLAGEDRNWTVRAIMARLSVADPTMYALRGVRDKNV
ncbi:Dimethylallyltranstransferase [Dactylellina cionopaga]|nr:Dimethylallyltranstransferase [Dactylellina cionopaga]